MAGGRKEMTGRPSLYSAEITDKICDRLAAGESLNAICRDERMPSRKVVHEWVADDRNGFRDKYARAREMQADYYADQIIEIADDDSKDWISCEDETVLNHEHVQRSRLRVEARKWLMARMAPKKYGDKLQTENNTTLNTSDPLTALLERIASEGAKVHDPRPQ
jgi:hypothetical protein